MALRPKPDFERYLKALHCEEPDRVPLGDWHVDKLPMEAFLGRTVETIADAVEFWQAAGFDYITASSGILEPVRAPEGMSRDASQVYSEYGDKVQREWAQEGRGLITNWDEFEQYRWPSVDDFDLSKWDVYDSILPGGMKAVFLLGKIYTPVWMFMGAEVFFDALENNPELVEAIFEKIGRIQFETFLRVIEHPCVGAVLNPDDIAHNTGLLVNPKHLKRYLFPWYQKMGNICRQKGLGFIFHSDGDCSEVMDDLIACGFHAFNPIQPNSMDIVEVKQQWGDKLCLIGNINLDSTLTLGTPDDVRAEVYERIRTIGPGGGYMVASSNSVTDYVPLANMKAMFEATFEFGKYPIELEEGGIKGKIWTYQGKGKTEEERIEAAAAPPVLDPTPFVDALLGHRKKLASTLFQEAMDQGMSAQDVVTQGLVPAMTLIGRKFQRSEIYIPEMMLSAQTMAEVIDSFQERIAGRSHEKAGTVAIGTVKGDLHDIGKNLVILMLKGQGFKVHDLGVNVSPEEFAQAVANIKPDILALSALLTTTMIEMEYTIQNLIRSGVRDEVKVIVGGAPLTQQFADQIGADGYAYDAPGASKLCKRLLA